MKSQTREPIRQISLYY